MMENSLTSPTRLEGIRSTERTDAGKVNNIHTNNLDTFRIQVQYFASLGMLRLFQQASSKTVM